MKYSVSLVLLGATLRDGGDGMTALRFACPKCYLRRATTVGVHSVRVLIGPGHYEARGGGVSSLSLVRGERDSIELLGGCGWHGHVRGGCCVWEEEPLHQG